MDMVKKIVYVLGAGASVDAGGPLMKDFFSKSHQDDEKIYPRYFDGNIRYKKVYTEFIKWKNDHPNGTMEQFFDHIANIKFLRGVSPDVERDLIWYIGSYVVNRIKKRRIKNYYWDFASLLKKRGFRSVIITFNYDLILEKLLYKTDWGFDYCLKRFGRIYKRDWMKNSDEGIKLLKLHGSVNWAFCDTCNALYLQPKPIVQKLRRDRCKKRGHGFLNPFLVPPSWNKNEYLQSIDVLWQQAKKELQSADILAIAGYSFPQADQYARTLLSYANQSHIKLIIANYNPNVINKIQKLINRPSLISRGLYFQEFVTELPELLKKAK
jgi:NAD-dependent SIR2 family protein deacetylase